MCTSPGKYVEKAQPLISPAFRFVPSFFLSFIPFSHSSFLYSFFLLSFFPFLLLFFLPNILPSLLPLYIKKKIHLNTLSLLSCKWNGTKGALSLYVYAHVLTNPDNFLPYSFYHTDQKTQIIVASNNPNMLTFPIHSCQNDVIKSKLHFMINASG